MDTVAQKSIVRHCTLSTASTSPDAGNSTFPSGWILPEFQHQGLMPCTGQGIHLMPFSVVEDDRSVSCIQAPPADIWFEFQFSFTAISSPAA
jgi:hypothetical protein